MILQALVRYYDILAQEGELPIQGYSRAKVSYALVLSGEGALTGILPLKTQEIVGKKTVERPRWMIVPEQEYRSGSGAKPYFICDNSGYMLGIDQKGKPERSRKCFEAAAELTLTILADVEGESARAIRNFFATWQPDEAEEHSILQEWMGITEGENLIFYVNGRFASEDASIKKAWSNYISQKDVWMSMQCLVTGKKGTIARLHPMIKGVQGAQSSGASIVSFNSPSNNSYGLENGGNAPVGEEAAYAYTTVLNYMLSNRKYKVSLGDMTVVFWAESIDKEYEDYFASVLNTPDDAQDKLESIWGKVKNGEAIDNLRMDTSFYVLGLSPNAARLSIRFFMKSTFGSILENLMKHQERLEIIKPVWERKYLSLYWLLRETVNEKSKDKSPTPLLAGSMLRSILMGRPYPAAFYQGIILRVKAEHNVSSGKAAAIKAFLLYGQTIDKKEGLTVALNESYKEKSYVLGRLFAVLEWVQENADPNLNSTIKDRYFSSACTSPGLVFPRLIKLANYHIAKGKKSEAQNNKKIAIMLEKKIGELLNMLTADQEPFPMQMPLKDQGLFMMGYYQQKQDRYTSHKKEEEEQ